MNEHDNQDEQLWRRVAPGRPAGPSPVDPESLAAYLDGTASARQIEQIEAQMASDPALLGEAAELRQLLGATPTAAPESLLGRAKALAPEAPVRAGPVTTMQSWWRRTQWAAAAAAVVIACWSGYSFGRGTFQGQRRAQAASAAHASAWLEEMTTEPGLGIPQSLNGRNGGES